MANIAIIGGGLMGVGIAQVFISAGYDVAVFEPDLNTRSSVVARIDAGLEVVGRGAAGASRVIVCDNLADAVAQALFVTEAAPEKLAVKQALFAQLVEHAPSDAILASNSSVIPISCIAEGLPTAHRMVGTHWWNPAPLIPLVEVIQGTDTSFPTIEVTMSLLKNVGKEPAYVKKDVPGFVGNRLQHALWREAIAMVAEGICDAATLDACVRNSFGLRLPVLGPLENADLVGLDLTLDIHQTIIPALDRHEGPHEYLRAKVAEGKLGFKSGEGFRTWTDDEMRSLRGRLTDHLVAVQRAKEV